MVYFLFMMRNSKTRVSSSLGSRRLLSQSHRREGGGEEERRRGYESWISSNVTHSLAVYSRGCEASCEPCLLNGGNP